MNEPESNIAEAEVGSCAEMAEAFATGAINALTLGYLIVQGWIDAKGTSDGGKS